MFGAVVPAESLAVHDNLHRRITSDPADELQFRRVAMVKIEDGVFLDPRGIIRNTDRV